MAHPQRAGLHKKYCDPAPPHNPSVSAGAFALFTAPSVSAGKESYHSPKRKRGGSWRAGYHSQVKLREIATPDQWKTLFAAQSGYLLDAMDILLYVFALNTLKHEFGLTNRMAGLVSSVTLISSAAGGILCGVLAD